MSSLIREILFAHGSLVSWLFFPSVAFSLFFPFSVWSLKMSSSSFASLFSGLAPCAPAMAQHKNNRLLLDKQVFELCRLFICQHPESLAGLRNNFVLHLTNLRDSYLLTSEQLQSLLELLELPAADPG